MMIVWSWIAAIVLVIVIVGLITLIMNNFETALVIFLVVILLVAIVLGIMAAQEYIFLPWLQTWDIGW